MSQQTLICWNTLVGQVVVHRAVAARSDKCELGHGTDAVGGHQRSKCFADEHQDYRCARAVRQERVGARVWVTGDRRWQ
jgi:hypothetical protein